MYATAEAPEKSSLRRIAQRIAARIGADVEPKADSRGCPAPLLHADAPELCGLDPPELTAGDANRSACRILAEAGMASGQPDLATDLEIELSELLERPIEAPVASCHIVMLNVGSHPPLTAGFADPLGGSTVEPEPPRVLDRRHRRASGRHSTRPAGHAAIQALVDPPTGSTGGVGQDKQDGLSPPRSLDAPE